MCGIYGVLALDGGGPGQATGALDAMGAAIVHRGPDDQGSFADGPLLMGMRRLSIIDLAGGHQPIASEDGNVVVVCNGEIYNYRALRRELQQAGHRFATASDTEVLVHAYEEYGDDFLKRLEGMFALALWDRRRRRLLVARDPLGIKPLYYRQTARELVFASEAKALLRLPGARAELDRAALAEYLALGYVGAPNCLFSGMRKLPPASALCVEDGRTGIRCYWRPPADVDRGVTEDQWIERLRAELERAIRDQMVSDVPIGAFLSGGIDSSTVVALMSRHSELPIRTYSIGFRGTTGADLYNELPHARQVAEAFRTRHREILVHPDVAALLPRLVWHLDEPVSDAAFITTFLVSQFAREDVTVILSGVGGDELFGGYRRYQDSHYRDRYRRLPRFLRRGLLEPIARRLPIDRHSRLLNELRLARAFILADPLSFEERYAQFMAMFGPAELEALLRGGSPGANDRIARAFAATQSADPLRRLMDVDLATQLPDDLLMLTDRMSMAVSLECRVPLLDQRLVELAAAMPGSLKMPNGTLKHPLKRAMSGLLPDSILQREKRGFGAPVGAWFRHELSGLVAQLLSPACLERRGLLHAPAVAELLREHAAQRADRSDHILALCNLEIWCRLYLDGESIGDLSGELAQGLAA